MSRTKHNTKGPGYDYWGRRIESGTCGHGKAVKTRTNRRERKRDKQRLAAGEDMPQRAAI